MSHRIVRRRTFDQGGAIVLRETWSRGQIECTARVRLRL
jgi:hypothetical protein